MEVLWQSDSALTVREVSNGLPQNLAHTTVMTVLDRLMLTALDQTGDRTAALARFAQSVTGAEADALLAALTVLEGHPLGGDTRNGLWGNWPTRHC